jgi:hypothetical protein
MSGDVAVKGKKRWVIRWPTLIVLHAITLRAKRFGPHRVHSESRLSQRIQEGRQESRRAAPEP